MRVVSGRSRNLLGLAAFPGHLPDTPEERKCQTLPVRRPGGVSRPPGNRFAIRGGGAATVAPGYGCTDQNRGQTKNKGSVAHANSIDLLGYNVGQMNRS